MLRTFVKLYLPLATYVLYGYLNSLNGGATLGILGRIVLPLAAALIASLAPIVIVVGAMHRFLDRFSLSASASRRRMIYDDRMLPVGPGSCARMQHPA
jgi:hypothetical protein